MTEPYNPLDKLNLAESIQRRILLEPVWSLGDDDARKATGGAGVYALYYTGAFQDYAEISKRNAGNQWALPIYVGKAIPEGGRTGGIHQAEKAVGAVRDRLRRHARSINQAVNLNLGDFSFRSLVIDDVWIPLGENMLIETFKPLWNAALSGFGSNPTGGPRSTQASSRWDTLHPGRAGAGMSAGPEVDHVKRLVAEYITTLPRLGKRHQR